CSSSINHVTYSTTSINTHSLHDALPIFFTTGHESDTGSVVSVQSVASTKLNECGLLYAPHTLIATEVRSGNSQCAKARSACMRRSEEHTSELQSQSNLVCRLLLEKKKKL